MTSKHAPFGFDNSSDLLLETSRNILQTAEKKFLNFEALQVTLETLNKKKKQTRKSRKLRVAALWIMKNCYLIVITMKIRSLITSEKENFSGLGKLQLRNFIKSD